MTSSPLTSNSFLDPTIFICSVVALVTMIGPSIVVIARRDPPPWTVGAGGLFIGMAWSLAKATDWESLFTGLATFLVEWNVMVAMVWSLLALLTRGPATLSTDVPPRPSGLVSVPGLLGLLGLFVVAASVIDSLRRGDFSVPWYAGSIVFVVVPLALLGARPGARVARVRVATSALLLFAGLVVLFAQPFSGAPSDIDERMLGLLLTVFGGLAGWGPRRSVDDVGRWRRPRYLATAVLGAAVLGGATQFARHWESTRLQRSLDRLDPTTVPVAGPQATLLGGGMERVGIGDDQYPGLPSAALERFGGPLHLEPDAIVGLDANRSGVQWVGRTADGKPRLATLVRKRSLRQAYWLTAHGDVVGMFRDPSDPKRYRLTGIEDPLTLEGVVRALNDAPCNTVVAVDPAEALTAQELFDVCSQFGCTLEPPGGSCLPWFAPTPQP